MASIRPGRVPGADQELLFNPQPHNSSPAAVLAFSDRPYQRCAVDAVAAGLADGGRGQLRAACGTGKTKMAQWSAQQLVSHGGVVVIVAPTVGLVAQTLAAWNDGSHDHRALAVCSDPTVAADSFSRVEDILEPVTTDPDVIDAWLRLPNTAAIRLIVGTHASAHVIGEGLQKADQVADLFVIDEAHRSAGWIGKQTALIHDDDVLPALRRLYMTATPRIWSPSPRAESSTVSMDDEQVFGPVLFSYPFSQAIDEGYLDDYRVAVIGVTRAEVLAVLRARVRRATARSAPSEHTAMVQAATARAAAELGLRRVIAFCPRVADARQFALTFPATVQALPERLRPRRALHADYVHGGLTQAARRDVLATLTQPPNDGWTVISNAKCLSEGIDVPAVDGVAFTAPKKSFVDVVQAVGRALRRDLAGSGTATVIIPILLPDEQPSDAEAIDAGDFATLWEVVRALKAHDDTFSAALDAARATGHEGSGVLDRIEFVLPEGYQTPEFVEHLTIRLVQSATSSWWEGYGRLVEFHTQHGHCRVLHDHVTADGYKLGDWVSSARVAYKERRLAPDRVAALRKLDFVFDARQQDWDRCYAVAVAYHAQHGDLLAPHRFRADGVTLATWLARQRDAKLRGTLPAHRETLLNALGMNWVGTPDWHSRITELRAYHAEHGSLPNRQFLVISGALAAVRAARKRGQLTGDLIAELDAMGMPWQSPVPDWSEGYAHLVAFHTREGHANVPQDHVTDGGFKLGAWVAATRTAHRKGKLTDDQRASLEKVDFVVDVHDAAWEHAFTVALAYYAEHGDARPPSTFRPEGVRLLEWLRNQQIARARGTLSAERQARLSALGPHWAAARPWEKLLPEVRAYHADHGSLSDARSGVPVARALATLRAARKRDELTAELIAELDAMGMPWHAPTGDWWDGYRHLAAYHAREGHLRITTGYVADDEFALGAWVRSTRNAYRAGRLTSDQVTALQKQGFVFEPAVAAWEHGYAVAARFAAKFGHLRPASDFRDEDVALAGWLGNQRRQHRRGALAAERVARLTALGIEWQISAPSQDQRLTELRSFHTEHGRLPTEATHPALARWLSTMRSARRRGELDAATINALDTVGIDWNPLSPTEGRAAVSWREGYRHLVAFHAREGHLRFTEGFVTEDGYALGAWAKTVRAAYRQGRLSADQIDALHKLSFAVDAVTANWEHRYSVAAAYYAEHGHLRPPPDYRRQDVTLAPWLSQQRAAHEQGTLSADRVARLTAIGIEWQYKFSWDERLAQLRKYHSEYGCLPTQTAHAPLGAVLAKMRAAHRNGQLADTIVSALDELGIDWNPGPGSAEKRSVTWQEGFAVAVRFQRRHGHLDVRPGDPMDPADEGFDLVGWIRRRRYDRPKGKLTDEQIAQLDELGMAWDPAQAHWDHFFAACADFHARHGHLNVPSKVLVPNRRGKPSRLAEWIAAQRHKRNQLSAERIARLDALGMVWDPFSARWDANLAALQKFHAEHGHLNVPDGLRSDVGTLLTSVLVVCRASYRQGTLEQDRIRVLEALDIDWSPSAGAWDRMIAALRAYHTEHGDILVPPDYTTEKGAVVADWLTLQRARRVDGHLTDDQIAELDALGMIWEKGGSRWARTLGSLRAYHGHHGHIRIAHQDGENDPEARRLYGLLSQLRSARAKGTLPAHKIDALDALGIDWNPDHGHDQQWRSSYEQAAEFYRAHGNLDVHRGHTTDTGLHLYAWLAEQRNQQYHNQLSVERVAMLEAIGITWKASPAGDAAWDSAYAALSQYSHRHGSPERMPHGHRTAEGFWLHDWLNRQRRAVTQGTLSPDRVQKLINLGVQFVRAPTARRPARQRAACAPSSRPHEPGKRLRDPDSTEVRNSGKAQLITGVEDPGQRKVVDCPSVT